MAARVIQECDTGYGWQTVIVHSHTNVRRHYLVTIPPWDRDQPEHISCECEGYEFRGRCSHQGEALTRLCLWSELDGRPKQGPWQTENLTCPRCGGPTRKVIIETE